MSNASNQSRPVFGILSMVLGPLTVLVTFIAASSLAGSLEPNWFNEYPQYFMQYVWLELLAISFMTGVTGLIKREYPRWVAMSGVILTLSLLTFLTVFLRWFED